MTTQSAATDTTTIDDATSSAELQTNTAPEAALPDETDLVYDDSYSPEFIRSIDAIKKFESRRPRVGLEIR